MATIPEDDEPEAEPLRERIARVAAAPTRDRNRPVTLLAISAALASLAPLPFGGIVAALLVIVAFDRGKR